MRGIKREKIFSIRAIAGILKNPFLLLYFLYNRTRSIQKINGCCIKGNKGKDGQPDGSMEIDEIG